MAKCSVCGKATVFGNNVSHSHRRSNRAFKPNLRRVRAFINGAFKKVYVCTRCLRSGKVERNIRDIKINDAVVAETIDVAAVMDAVAEAAVEQ